MNKVSKDSAKSFEQLRWQHAVASHERAKNALTKCTNEKLQGIYQRQIDNAETEFPQLKRSKK